MGRKKKITSAEKAKAKRLINSYAKIIREKGAGGFKILRTKKSIKAAEKAGLKIRGFNLIKLNSYISETAPLTVSSNGNIITQRAIHKYNSHMRKWHFHRVIIPRATAKNKARNDFIIDAFRQELDRASKEIKKATRRKCVGIFMWGPLGILYNRQASSPELFLEYLSSWLNSSVSGRELDTDNLLGFAWASHPCDKPINFPNSPKRLKKGRVSGKGKKWRGMRKSREGVL